MFPHTLGFMTLQPCEIENQMVPREFKVEEVSHHQRPTLLKRGWTMECVHFKDKHRIKQIKNTQTTPKDLDSNFTVHCTFLLRFLHISEP